MLERMAPEGLNEIMYVPPLRPFKLTFLETVCFDDIMKNIK